MWTVSLYQDVKAACVATAGPYNLRAVRCRVCSYGKPPGWSCPRLSLRPAQPPQESSFLPSRHLHLGSGHRHDDGDRKSTRLNSSHMSISYAVFCLKKKKKNKKLYNIKHIKRIQYLR